LSPVLSYLRTDPATGAEFVVNVTQYGHPLFPGYVARIVTPVAGGAIVQNYGEGAGLLQNPGGLFADDINSIWLDQTQGIINNLHGRAPCGGSPNKQ
jgi:hypothetical protein